MGNQLWQWLDLDGGYYYCKPVLGEWEKSCWKWTFQGEEEKCLPHWETLPAVPLELGAREIFPTGHPNLVQML